MLNTSHSILIEICCSTERAATLLNIPPSKLNQAKRSGKLPCQHTTLSGTWLVYAAGQDGKKNLWTVYFRSPMSRGAA